MSTNVDPLWWLAMIVAAILAVIPFLIVPQRRWWPGAFGWAIDFLSIGLAVSDNFHGLTPLAIAGLIVGSVLGFTGVLTGPNSPVV